MLAYSQFETPLGEMVAVANDRALVGLTFADYQAVDSTWLKTESPILQQIEQELAQYFSGHSCEFKTPIDFALGTHFQKQVWRALQTIPVGETWSYAELAESVGRKGAFRAAANANGANPLAIIVPCHRVVRTGGALGGYATGVERKAWLLKHEEKYFKKT